jgi:hypothetical protein
MAAPWCGMRKIERRKDRCETVLRELEQSGLSMAGFCRRRDLPYATVAECGTGAACSRAVVRWRCRRRRSSTAGSVKRVSSAWSAFQAGWCAAAGATGVCQGR